MLLHDVRIAERPGRIQSNGSGNYDQLRSAFWHVIGQSLSKLGPDEGYV